MYDITVPHGTYVSVQIGQAKLNIVLAVALVTSATSLGSFFRHLAMHLNITGNVQGSLTPS